MHKDDGEAEHERWQESSPAAGDTLVIRTWLEHGEAPPSFRARITYGAGVEAGQTSVYAADPDKVLSLVRQWLQAQTAVQSRG